MSIFFCSERGLSLTSLKHYCLQFSLATAYLLYQEQSDPSTMSSIDIGASITNIENSIFIMKNSNSEGCETLEAPNQFLNPSIVSIVTIFIWSCFIIEILVLQVQVVVSLFNLESLFSWSK